MNHTKRWRYCGFAVLLAAVMAACNAAPAEPQSQIQGLLTTGQKTATSAVHIATLTARAAASSTALAVSRATATADWAATGRRTLNRDFSKWEVIGTMVARYTATPTPAPTATP